MDIERYRYQGRLGIIFHVNRFIIQRSDRMSLYGLHFHEVRQVEGGIGPQQSSTSTILKTGKT